MRRKPLEAQDWKCIRFVLCFEKHTGHGAKDRLGGWWRQGDTEETKAGRFWVKVHFMVKQIGLVDRGSVGWERRESKLVRRFWQEQSEGMHCAQLCLTCLQPHWLAHQAPLVHGIFQARVLECRCHWVAISYCNQKNRVAIYWDGGSLWEEQVLGKIRWQFWRKELQLLLEWQGLNGTVLLTCWFILIVNTLVIHHLGW